MAVAIRQVVNRCGFPAMQTEAAGASMELTPDQGEAWASIGRAIKRRGIAIVYGNRGRGKTHIAALAGLQWWRHGFYDKYGACRYWTVPDLMAEQRRWFEHKRNEHGDIAEPFWVARDCGLLVLDEANEIKRDSGFEADSLVQIIDHRYRTAMPTLILTNLKPESFASIMGPSIVDRVKDRGTVVACDWGNMRDEIRKETL